MKKNKEKLTIYEFQEKYNNNENQKKFSLYLKLILSTIGIIVLVALFSLFKSVYEINKYAGYAVGGLCIIAFIFLFIVPVSKIVKLQKFETNITYKSLKKAKTHNKNVRKNLAEDIINLHTKTNDDEVWYSEKNIQNLIASKNDDNLLKLALNEIYKTDVKKAGKDIILKSALKSGMLSALSQTNLTDTLVVGAINIQMIKNIVYLYGFRPSDKKLVKIFSKVMTASLVSYGLGNVKLGNSIAKSLGDVAKGIPLLGSAISLVVDSSVQGLSNAVLTAIIGNNTVKYLIEEYKLQDLIDSIEFPTNEEFSEICEEVKKMLKQNKKSTIPA